jgi:hypothetical protein
MDNIRALCDVVRQTAYSIHKYHRNGHLEKVYENRKLSLHVLNNIRYRFPMKYWPIYAALNCNMLY